ncbi:hypothetical protein [Chelatococcus asaccharovorans]|uniref:Uncharacterized protein n=1 Tax=Chelatococcus asaccharovorans TaxID=28210 RepID=A0A2V3U7S3_9HYPH|nr:hypothetical protein [Chelatococcus asaccharovorans]MBS7703988.1 hypothetical protein [Chelatococcus asaccharovorans]PXW58152.1 hypothetical protein C7450_106328 [Chelatococcus asaccharovorans]CAH1667128.1 conserved hypothetical protein [Chelatococcus asaccharovorans]CAH1681141.1 conserved hypothetical protein [Chelatococcus asaccharovorans]
MRRPHLHTIQGGSGRRGTDSSGVADARAIVVDDDELGGGWVAVDIDHLPFVPMASTRMRLAWRYRGTVEGRFADQSRPPLPEPAEDPPCGVKPARGVAAQIPPDRIVRVGRDLVPSPRAQAWAEAARLRQRELEAMASADAQAPAGEGDAPSRPGETPAAGAAADPARG